MVFDFKVALYGYIACHSVTNKFLATIFPITAFVAMVFEHSVANMYFIPAGMIAQLELKVMQAVGNVDLSQLNWMSFMGN